MTPKEAFPFNVELDYSGRELIAPEIIDYVNDTDNHSVLYNGVAYFPDERYKLMFILRFGEYIS